MITLIANSAALPRDCACVIQACLGSVCWSEGMGDVKPSQSKIIQSNEDFIQLKNKVPSWNPVIQAYTLEFAGRAEMPSVHNFQLSEDEQQDVVLQLGKINETEYNMDYAFPLSPFQAFGICISVMDRSLVWD